MNTLNTIFAIIPRVDFQQEDRYCNFLSTFEKENGQIDHVIIRRCKNRNDDIILQVKLKPSPFKYVLPGYFIPERIK